MSYNQHQAQGYQQSQGYQLPVYPPQPPRPGTTQYSSQYGSETALRERQDGPNETDHDAGVNTNTPSAGNGNSKTSPCKPNALARLPWKGLLEVALSVCCIVAAVVVLRLSDGKPVAEWSGNRQPSTILAYTSTLANSLLTMGLAEAVTISFWRRALKGAKLLDFHYYWLGGSGAWGAVQSSYKRRAIVVSCACLVVAITGLLRGPLMQRATTVESRETQITGTLDVGIAAAMDETWGGVVSGRQKSVMLTSNFSTVLTAYQNRAPITLRTSPCENCTMSVKAFGFDVSCTTGTIPYNINNMMDLKTDEFANGIEIFSMDVGTDVDDKRVSTKGNLILSETRKRSKVCEGNLKQRNCTLKPSTMLYNISMSGSNVTFLSNSWKDDIFVQDNPLTHLSQIFTLGDTLGALEIFTRLFFDSSVLQQYQGPAGFSVVVHGQLGNSYMANREVGLDGCGFTFTESMDDVINSLREFALRMSVQTATEDASLAQTGVPYTARQTEIVHVTNMANLLIAVIVSLLGPLAVLPLFWGSRSLGRTVSLSPLETANALCGGRGVFSDVAGNATASEIAEALDRAGGASVEL